MSGPEDGEVSRTAAAVVAAVLDGDPGRADILLAQPGTAAAVALRLAEMFVHCIEDRDVFRAWLDGQLQLMAAGADPGPPPL